MASLGSSLSQAGLDEAWGQVAPLKPRLAPQVELHKHRYRGEVWLVLSDKMTGTHFRCASEVEGFLRLLDGVHTVEDAAQATLDEEHRDYVELIRLLAELQDARLLLDLAPTDSEALLEQQKQLRRQRWLKRLASPLAIQVPLLDPDAFLARCANGLRWLFSTPVLWAWLLLVAAAAIIATDRWSDLQLHWESRFLDPGNLLMLWLLYPLVKGLHELGHGIATRVWGGEVHEMGVMLLVFTPVPYVDASASSAFASRWQRLVVAAAGIMVELFLSAIALLLWLNSEPGLLRDACFNVMVIGGLSTLLFNGNPLLRFDGYYVLTDLLEMPNLRSRANEYLGYLLKHHLLHLSCAETPSPTTRERAWLLGYSVLSGIYRIFIGLTIALFIAGKYFFIGATLALWLILSQILLPLVRLVITLSKQAAAEGKLVRFGAVWGGGSVALAVVLFVIPMSNSTGAEGIVTLAENTELRTEASGFVAQVLKRDGNPVQAGDTLLVLENSELRTEAEMLEAELRELDMRYNAALSGEPVELEILKREIAAVRDDLEETRSQLGSLEITSPREGIFSLNEGTDLPGRFLRQGDLVGHVLDDAAPSVRVVLPESDVDRVVRSTRSIEVRLASRPGERIAGEPLRDVPKATRELPSALLGSREGGDIAVDARDQAGRTATRPVFQLEVALPERASGRYLGRRAYVKFEHYREPVGIVWFRQIRQIFVTKLGI